MFALIIALADSIDAMISDRPYRRGMSSEECRKEMEQNKGIMYDQAIADLVIANWDEILKKEWK